VLKDNKNIATEIALGSKSLLAEYMSLTKIRLSLTVVFTSLLGFFIAGKGGFRFEDVLLLFTGGLLVTASANALNQVLEKDYDKLMSRTADRPLAAGRMKISDAVLFSGISCTVGVSLLAMFNPLTAVLGMLSLILYAFVYTPLKRFSSAAVAVGAIPGALPVLIGCTAAEGYLSMLAFGLFFIQFFWQFPHFWSIGFLGFDDYKKAEYKFIPESNGQIERSIALNGLIYTLAIIPVIGYFYYLGNLNVVTFLSALVMTLAFAYFSFRFHKHFDRKSALAVMFFSFIYMPVLLVAFLVT
jgi:protoheme IX farnesyltransferase